MRFMTTSGYDALTYESLSEDGSSGGMSHGH